MFISLDGEKAFDKNPTWLHDKRYKEVVIEATYLNTITDI